MAEDGRGVDVMWEISRFSVLSFLKESFHCMVVTDAHSLWCINVKVSSGSFSSLTDQSVCQRNA